MVTKKFIYYYILLTYNMVEKLEEIELIELNEAYQKVLYWFFSFPNMETGLNDLSSDLKISKTTAKKIINALVDEGFLNKRIYGKTWRITCDKDHLYNLTTKIAFNLAMVYGAYYGSLRDHILKIVGNAKSIVLFGSYRKGDDNEESDVDIAVEVTDRKGPRIVELGMIPKFGFRENVKINLHIFSRDNIDLNLFSNIANGIVLEGFLEVRP